MIEKKFPVISLPHTAPREEMLETVEMPLVPALVILQFKPQFNAQSCQNGNVE